MMIVIVQVVMIENHMKITVMVMMIVIMVRIKKDRMINMANIMIQMIIVENRMKIQMMSRTKTMTVMIENAPKRTTIMMMMMMMQPIESNEEAFHFPTPPKKKFASMAHLHTKSSYSFFSYLSSFIHSF